MDKCPAEVLHQVCALIDSADAANLRLTCKTISPIAEDHVVRGQLRFHLSIESLQRLKLFAKHAVFSQKVTKIYYEANILLPIASTQEYGRYFNCGSGAEPPPDPPGSEASSRDMRVYLRNLNKWKQGDKGLSPKKLQEQLEAYTKAYNSQQEIIRNKSDIKILTGAMPQFPKLTEVYVVNVGRCKHALSERFWERFPDGFRPPMSIDTEITVRQLDSVLRPANKSSLRILDAKVITPKILSNISAKTSLMGCFANLHKLLLAFRLGDLESEELAWDEPGHLYRAIRKGHLREVLSRAPKLRDLSILFDDCCHHPHSFASLKDMFGEISWKQLKRLDLSRFDSTAKDMVEMLQRQPKLTTLELSCVTLTSGNWATVLSNMRKTLKLDRTDFQGWLRSTSSPEEFMIMDYISIDDFNDDPECLFTLSDSIDMYLTDRDYEEFDLEDDFNPINRLEDFMDVEELQAEMDVDSSEFDMIMSGMF